VEGIGGKYF